MRKNWLLLLTIFFSLGLGFTSCGDDDDDPIVEETVFGVYKGTMDIDVEGAGFPGMDGIKAKVNLADAGQNKVKFLLKDFSFGDLELGDIAVQSADIRNTGSQHEISGIEKGLKLQKIGTCDVNITGTVVGEQITLNITVDVDDTVFEGGLKVEVKFNGTKMATDQSSEAEILAFEFDPEVAEANKLVTKVEQKDKNFYLTVSDAATEEDLKKLIPTITVSDKATLSPESGKVQDFSKSVVYTVKSEDGIKENKYTVSIASTATFFDFEEWEYEMKLDKGKEITESSPAKDQYKRPIDGTWATSNAGAAILYGTANSFVVMPTDKAVTGENGALITTINTQGEKPAIPSMIPKVTSGTLFLGKFELNYFDQLSSPKFGVVYDKKPLIVKGSYQYKSGEVYYEVPEGGTKGKPVAVIDKKDECAIRAILYEKTEELGVLTGKNIGDNSNYVGFGEFTSKGADKFEDFEVEIEYLKDYDPKKEYYFTVIFTSSLNGDKFNGAPGSELIIDNVEIINEK